MADYTYNQLKKMTVARLREIAQGIQDEAVQGFSTMHKEQLLPILCKLLGVETHHAVHAAEKLRIKATIRKLKARRDETTAAGDSAALATARQQIHALKRKLRKMAARGA